MTHQEEGVTQQEERVIHQKEEVTHQEEGVTHQEAVVTHQEAVVTHQKEGVTHLKEGVLHNHTHTHHKTTGKWLACHWMITQINKSLQKSPHLHLQEVCSFPVPQGRDVHQLLLKCAHLTLGVTQLHTHKVTWENSCKRGKECTYIA